MNPQEIWGKFKEGDREAFQFLYSEYVDLLVKFGRYYTKDEDLLLDEVQSLYVYLWENKAKLSVPTSPKSYLLKAFKNRLIEHFRKDKKRNSAIESSFSNYEKDLSQEDEIIDIELKLETNAKLNEALKSLTSKQKQIIFLKYSENISYEEIAEMLDINYQSVRNLAHRAITSLRNEILFLIVFFFAK